MGRFSPGVVRRGINLWPPFLFSGIRVRRISDDWREIDVSLTLSFYNRNMSGVHFGGTLFAMTDAFYMLMLSMALGRDYVVWDQAASIRFVKPGRGTVRASFRLTEAGIAAIRADAASGGAVRPEYDIEITDEAGDVVACVHKTLYVRRKKTQGVSDRV